jgi:hypothetical protein
MNDFRRFIISIIDTLQLLLIIGVTLVFAIVGAGYAALMGAISGQGAGGGAFLGFLLGGLMGFVMSASVAAISLTLAEIAHNTREALEILRSTTHGPLAEASSATSGQDHGARYDRAKWNALIQHDEEIARVAEKLRSLGDKWVYEFASSYLPLNDKRYLEPIVKKIIQQARDEHAYVSGLQSLDSLGRKQKFIFTTERGIVATLLDGRAVLINGNDVKLYDSLENYRTTIRDHSAWTELKSIEDKREFYRSAPLALKRLNDELT